MAGDDERAAILLGSTLERQRRPQPCRRLRDRLAVANLAHVERAMPQHILFICTQNRLRSPTAEQVFADWPGIETASAGLGNDADTPVSAELLAWSDLIFVMEKVHRNRLSKRFGPHLNGKRVICLGIPDDYDFMAPALIELLRRKVPPFLSGMGARSGAGEHR
jgi:predicted protein tyrosine phosphatase